MAFHISVWYVDFLMIESVSVDGCLLVYRGTGTDITLQDPPNSQVIALGTRSANWFLSLQANFDLAFAEFLGHSSLTLMRACLFNLLQYTDRDSAYYDATATDGSVCAPGKPGCTHWFDSGDYDRNIVLHPSSSPLSVIDMTESLLHSCTYLSL